MHGLTFERSSRVWARTRISTLSRAGLISLAGVALLGWMVGCAAGPRTRPIKGADVEIGGGTLAQARSYLEGRWTLISYEVLPPGQAPIQVKGQGTLVYDEFSNLNMEIRVDEATAERLKRVGIPSTDGTISAKGRTAVDLQRKALTYMLEGQPTGFVPDTGPLAPNRPRYWEVSGNVLTLTTRSDDGKPLSVGKWQKSAP
jgi:hypothetical protein